jgi:hypothetical protein
MQADHGATDGGNAVDTDMTVHPFSGPPERWPESPHLLEEKNEKRHPGVAPSAETGVKTLATVR